MRAGGRLGRELQIALGRRASRSATASSPLATTTALGIVNGDAGVVAAIGADRLSVELDRGRRVDVPVRYARDGHLDHGYALTAHRAQGATVDRAFVLGSDELYREWGYTALSRHRDEARFYVSATPTFLNAGPPPLEAGDDVARRVVDMLQQSRAEQLALNGVRPDHRAERLVDEIEVADKRLHDIEQRIDLLRDARERTRWYQLGRRTD